MLSSLIPPGEARAVGGGPSRWLSCNVLEEGEDFLVTSYNWYEYCQLQELLCIGTVLKYGVVLIHVHVHVRRELMF